MKKINIFLAAAVIFTACSGNGKQKLDDDIVAKVNDKTLSYNDLKAFADNYSGVNDSAKIVAEYVKNWAENEFLYSKAEDNFRANSEIEKLVEDYRKSLILNNFKKKIIADNPQIPTNEQIVDYYSQHLSEFKLAEPVVKGAFLQISRNTPQKEQAQLKQDMRQLSQESIEKIEKYSMKKVVNYEFFTDKWQNYSKIAEQLPLPAQNKDAFVSSAKFYELSDTLSIYYFAITEYKTTSADTPLDFVKDLITSILTEQNNLKYIENYSQKLYENAVKKGKIVIND
ncbi:MAG: hypothetical protein LBN95_08630 [Prevotellaceae bacterium]|jgi:hypothetical protein|nr:hypothetical protein [Prevotellaceae bacterium]